MKSSYLLIFVLFTSLFCKNDAAYLVPIQGDIDMGLPYFIERAIVAAESDNADVIIFDIDTFGGRVDAATSAEFNVIGNEVTMTADGYVGAVQMTLSHGSDFQINLTDNALVAEYVTNGNTTELMIVEPADESLFTTNGDFTIESVIAASNGETYMQTTVNLPKDYSISAAYPNPFNPTTQMSLELNTDANVSIKVFNTMGQLVDVITEGQMAGGNYSFSWDATNSASGIYFIHTEVGDQLNTQKIMLVK